MPSKSRNHMTSAQRALAALLEARIKRPEVIEMQSGVEQEIEIAPLVEGSLVHTAEDYCLRGISAQKESLDLDARVWRLFEETRDGKETPESYRQELINNPTISGNQVFDAVDLGIRSWGPALMSKER
jgi:hypothetical protein